MMTTISRPLRHDDVLSPQRPDPNGPTPKIMTAPAVKSKDLAIETLRGLAIIMMVMGHAIGATSDAGMQVADASAYRWFYDIFAPLRMPLFTVISGYIYAIRPVASGSVGSFLRGKSRRLLLPLLSVASLQFIADSLLRGNEQLQDIWMIPFLPYDHFWFLQAIAMIFLLVTLLEITSQIQTARKWLLWTLLAACIYVFIPKQPWMEYFSLYGVRQLMVFFLLGVGLSRFRHQASARHWLSIAIVSAIGGWVIQQLDWWGYMDDKSLTTTAASLAIGVSGTYLLIRLRPTAKPLIWIGAYAYTIYLLHGFGVGGSRLLLQNAGIDALLLLIIVTTVVGCLAPVLGDWVLNRYAMTRRVFLGKR